jgi:mono/diheme cytochrome c family protein
MESALLDLARTPLERLRMWRSLALLTIWCAGSAHADQASDGKALLERNCGRCHAVVPGADSPRNGAPNLSIVLESYPAERLESELAEGIRPKHPEMPQVRFSPGEITSIYHYLHGKAPESEYRKSQ